MSNNELFKLKKELEKFKEKIEELNQQNMALEEKYVICSRERDEFEEAALYGERIKNNVKNLIDDAVRKEKEMEKANYDKALQELNILRSTNEKNVNQIKILQEEISNKDLQIQNLRRDLKNMKRRQEGPEFNETKWDQDQKQQNEETASYKKKLEAERKKFGQLSEKMDNILAENRVLRRLAQVPENYGFNLEEIKIAEMQQIEDYKAQNRNLEKLNEELEVERLQLRNRLRILSNLYDQRPKGDRYKNLTREQLEKLDEFVADQLLNQIPSNKLSTDPSKLHEKDLIIKELQEKVRQCEREHSNMRNDSAYHHQPMVPTSQYVNQLRSLSHQIDNKISKQ